MDFKIAFVGDSNVGKTSIIQKYKTNGKDLKDQNILPTIGSAFEKFEITCGDKTVNLNVWDTAGQEEYHSFVPLFTRDSSLIVLVFSLNNKQSFDNIDIYWYKLLSEKLELKCPFVLVGNKTDLEQIVSKKEAESWAKNKKIPVFFTSAMTNENIVSLFSSIANIVSQQNLNENDQNNNEPIIDLNENTSKKSCC